MTDNCSNEWIGNRSRRSTAASGSPPSRTMADLLILPDADRSLINWLIRQQSASLTEIAAHLDQDESQIQGLLDPLIEQGFVQALDINGVIHYQPRLVSRRGRQVSQDIWSALDS